MTIGKTTTTFKNGAAEDVSLDATNGDFHAVDFRKKDPDPIEQLIWGITGEQANPEDAGRRA